MTTEDVRRKPAVEPEQATRVAAESFGLDVVDARALPGERDANFHLRTSDNRRYVIKFAHPDAPRPLLECQNEVLTRLADMAKQPVTPRVVASPDGRLIVDWSPGGGETLAVRVLKHVPGTPLAEVSPHSPGLLRELGRTLAGVDQALLDYDHPAAHREFTWDLKHGEAAIRENAGLIKNPEQSALRAQFAARFAEIEITRRLAELRQSVIHNDANDYNVLASFEAAGESRTADSECVDSESHGLTISGLIDFGDIVHTALVSEVAIAAAYAMLSKDDPLQAAQAVIAGYHGVLPLEEAELAILFDLICLRLCVSVCMSARQSSLVAENNYLLVSQQPAWNALARLSDIHPHWATYQFRAACGLPPCPQSAAITRWIRDNRDTFAHVLPEAMMTGPRMTFDLSVGSRDFESFEQMADPRRFDEAVFSVMRRNGIPLGIGRYDEPRTVYASDVFAPRDNPNGEWRTIHIGVDLFAEAGTPVHVPCDGVIHGFADNANPLDYGPTIIVRHEVPVEDGDPSSLCFYSLYGHLSRGSLVGKSVGQRINCGEQIATLGAIDVNGGWPPHLHFQLIVDPLGASGDFPGVGRACDRAVWRSLSPNPADMLRLPAEETTFTSRPTEELREDRAEKLGRNLSMSYRQPLRIVRGHRQFLIDDEGRKFLDCVNNVAHVGHCHPRVVEAARKQLGVLNTNTRYLHETILEYADALTATLPESLSVCFFVNSGSEANDLALRMARAATGTKRVITVEGGYHGNLSSLIEISPYKFNGPGGSGPGEFTSFVPMPDSYRGKFRDADAGRKYAGTVADEIDRLKQLGQAPAAFVCESILSCGGQITLPEGYLNESYSIVRAAGGLCVADEVQIGFGRVGEHFWGFELHDVVPDIVTMGKPIGNGHPLGAVVTTPEIAAAFANGMEYFNTFGGSPVSCAVGLAVLRVIEEEGLQTRARKVGEHLLSNWRKLAQRHAIIGDVRGTGLFLGLEFVNDRTKKTPAARQTEYVVERMKEHRILLSTDGPDHNVIKFKPPMCFGASDADRLTEILERIVAETPAQPD